MIRLLFWFFVWCLSLGFASIQVVYRDGLRIRLYSHRERRERRSRKDEDVNND